MLKSPILVLSQEFLARFCFLVFLCVFLDRNFLPQKLGWGRILGIFQWIPRLLLMFCSDRDGVDFPGSFVWDLGAEFGLGMSLQWLKEYSKHVVLSSIGKLG